MWKLKTDRLGGGFDVAGSVEARRAAERGGPDMNALQRGSAVRRGNVAAAAAAAAMLLLRRQCVLLSVSLTPDPLRIGSPPQVCQLCQLFISPRIVCSASWLYARFPRCVCVCVCVCVRMCVCVCVCVYVYVFVKCHRRACWLERPVCWLAG